MRTTNSCADKPILLGDTLLPEQLADGLSCRGLQRKGKNAVRRVGPTYLKPGSSIFLLKFSVLLPDVFLHSKLGGQPLFAMYIFPPGSTSLSIPTFLFLGTENFAQTTLG